MSRIFPILALLLAIGIFFGYVNPTYKGSIATQKQEIKNYDSALAAADRFKKKEAQLATERAQIPADQLTRLESFLPDGVDNVQLILDLDALAARSGMRLANFDTSTPSAAAGSSSAPGTVLLESENPVDSIDLTMTGTGTYTSFRTFLAGIEGSLRPLDLVALDVRSTETGVYTYGLTIRLYWLR